MEFGHEVGFHGGVFENVVDDGFEDNGGRVSTTEDLGGGVVSDEFQWVVLRRDFFFMEGSVLGKGVRTHIGGWGG